MIDAPRLSVCIPTYNMGEWLAGAIESAIALGHTDEIEIVVVDNASIDDTPRVLSGFDACSNLRVVRSEEHLDMVENWNRAVRYGSGRWATVLSADDELLPSYYENVQRELDRVDTAAFVQTARKISRQGSSAFGPTTAQTFRLEEFVSLFGGGACISTTAFRRDLFELVGGFDPNTGLVLDFDLLVRMALRTGLPIRALGVEGGLYFAERGATWTRSEESGNAATMLLAWIDLRRAELGDDLESAARQALAGRAGAAGRFDLRRGRRASARRNYSVAVACSEGRERLKKQAALAVASLPAPMSAAAERVYRRLQPR